MYVAKSRIKVAPGVTRMPGDPVPEAEKWPATYLRAALNTNLIEKKYLQSPNGSDASKATPNSQAESEHSLLDSGSACDICEKTFKTKAGMKRHKRTHAA